MKRSIFLIAGLLAIAATGCTAHSQTKASESSPATAADAKPECCKEGKAGECCAEGAAAKTGACCEEGKDAAKAEKK